MAELMQQLDPGDYTLYPHQSTRSNPASSTDEENFRSHDSSARSMSSLATTVDSESDTGQANPKGLINSNGNHHQHSIGGSEVFYDALSSLNSLTTANHDTKTISGPDTIDFKDTGVLLNIRPRKSPSSVTGVAAGSDYFTNGHVDALRRSSSETKRQASSSPTHTIQPTHSIQPASLSPTASGPSDPPPALSLEKTEKSQASASDHPMVPAPTSLSTGPSSNSAPSTTTPEQRPFSQSITAPSAVATGQLTVTTSAGSTVVPTATAQHSTISRTTSPANGSHSANDFYQTEESSAISLPLSSPRTSITMPRAHTAGAIKPRIPSTSSQLQSRPNTARASISSQVSVSSSHRNSIDPALARVSSHRTSFSFTRRRSTTVVANRLSTSSVLDDNSASAQDIERLREAIIAHRESKRRRREYIEDERVLVGTKVSEGHVNFMTAYNMLTGIRVSVSRCNAKVDRQLVDADFKARHKLAFDISGNELTPSAKYDFKFKDYSPWVFRHLREQFKLDPADYLMSLTSKYIVSELGSPGKSGSFFYFSRDYRFIIKTIHHSEHKTLRRILKDYYYHVKKYPDTLISQFYGLHRVKLPFGRKIHFVVMNNLFPPHRDIHRTYDLKGSTLGRMLPEVDEKDGKLRKSAVYKDMNWLRHSERIRLGPTKRQEFLKQLEVDVELLKRLNIMDYSLLIGVHDLTIGNSENIRDSTLSVFDPEPKLSKVRVAELRKALSSASPQALLSIDALAEEQRKHGFTFYADNGVIDCLTPYTFYKRVETFWKTLSHPKMSVSALPADEYGDRFFNFIKSVVTHPRGKRPVYRRTAPDADSSSAAQSRGAGSSAGQALPTQQLAEQSSSPSSSMLSSSRPDGRGDGHLPALTEASTETSAPASKTVSAAEESSEIAVKTHSLNEALAQPS